MKHSIKILNYEKRFINETFVDKELAKQKIADIDQALQLLQTGVSSSSWEVRKTESKLRAVFKMNWDSEKLIKFRKLLGFSQNEFANLIGIHQATLSNYEKGRAIAETETMEKVTSICNEWKESKIKHLESEIEFIRSF